MAIDYPNVSGVIPSVSDTDVELRPTIQVIFGGPSLVDPLSWGSRSFALYGPGDVVLETGPGTILNSGMDDAPYPLLDGPLRRDNIEGTFDIYVSGQAQASGVTTAGNLGVDGTYVIGLFTPSAPLNANTTYTAVIAGDDNIDFLTADRRYPGVTTWTSASGFSLTPAAATSGAISVLTPYQRNLQTNIYNASTGYNDTYTVTVTSGTGPYQTAFSWSKASSVGTYAFTVSGTEAIDFGYGLTTQFTGPFETGEVFELATYIPLPLLESVTWSFDTGTVSSYATPPSTPPAVSIVIDDTATGGIGVGTSTNGVGQLRVISTWPPALDYDVDAQLPYISIEFNKTLTAGAISFDEVTVQTTPLLGLPTVQSPLGITPSMIETSGRFMTIWL